MTWEVTFASHPKLRNSAPNSVNSSNLGTAPRLPFQLEKEILLGYSAIWLQTFVGSQMSESRKNDPNRSTPFRSERLVEEGGKWFFYTREGTLEGPYQDMIEVKSRLEKYISVMNSGLLSEDSSNSLELCEK